MSLKILLADDSMTAQNMGKKILADAGYDVIAVSNGAAAIKKISEVKPQLLILDIYMPGYTGLEVCERVKNAPETAHVPVLLTVGKLEPYRPEDGNKVRAEAVIIKPFEATDLLAAVEKLAQRVSSSSVFGAAPAKAVEPVVQSEHEEEEAPEEFVAEAAPVAQQEVPATPMPFLADLPAPVPAFAIEESQPVPASEAPVFSSYIPASAAPAFFMDDTQPITPLRDSAPSFEISPFMPPSEVAAPVVTVEERVHEEPAVFDPAVAPGAEEHIFVTTRVEDSPAVASAEMAETPAFELQVAAEATAPVEEPLAVVPEEEQHKEEGAVFAAPVIAPEVADEAPTVFAITQDAAIELEVSGASSWTAAAETVEPTSVYGAPAVSEIEFAATEQQPSAAEPRFAAIEWKEPETPVEEPQHDTLIGKLEELKGFADFEAPNPEVPPVAPQVEVASEAPNAQGRYTDDVLVQLGVVAITPEPAAASSGPRLDFDDEPFFANEAAATVAPGFAKPEEHNFFAEAPLAEEVASGVIQTMPTENAGSIELAQDEESSSIVAEAAPEVFEAGPDVDTAMFAAFDSLSAEAVSVEAATDVPADIPQVAEAQEVPQAFAAAAAAGSQNRIASAVQRVFDRYREQMIADIARELEDE